MLSMVVIGGKGINYVIRKFPLISNKIASFILLVYVDVSFHKGE